MLAPRVLVPVNALDRAKGRLAEGFTAAERRQLAILTLGSVVEAARGAGLDVTLLTADETVADLEFDVRIDPELDGVRGLTPQLEAWVAANAELNALLILHADLPLATSAALQDMLAAAPSSPSVLAVQSPDGGTNAMLLQPAAGLELRYGKNSFALHRESARDAGIPFIEHVSPTLSLDLDTPADIETLLATPAGRASRAGRYLLARSE